MRDRHGCPKSHGRRLHAACALIAAVALWAGLASKLDATPVGIFNPEDGTLGNKTGSLKVLEFFDYNCGPCRHVFPAMLDLVAAEPRLKIVMIDFPILGPQSRDVARVAVAARMQDETGERFLAFHRQLMSGYGGNDAERAIAAARSAGFDMPRLARDLAAPAVDKVLRDTLVFAKVSGVDATPSFLMDGHVFAGEDGFHALRYKIEDTRK